MFVEVGSETVNSSRMRVLRFGITQLRSPPGPEASIWSSCDISRIRSSRVCNFGGSCEKLIVRVGSFFLKKKKKKKKCQQGVDHLTFFVLPIHVKRTVVQVTFGVEVGHNLDADAGQTLAKAIVSETTSDCIDRKDYFYIP